MASHLESNTPVVRCPPFRVALRAAPQRILIIKPSALGDVVHTLPVLRLLRRRYPQSHIAWMINPSFAGLIDGHPDLSEVIRFERAQFGESLRSLPAARQLRDFLRGLRRHEFDLVLDLQGLFRSAWLAWETRAAVRVGFSNARELAPFFYTHRVPIRDTEVHAVERYLEMARAVGCDDQPAEFDFAIGQDDRRICDGPEFDSLLATSGTAARRSGDAARRYAVLLPGTNWPTKQWPIEHFAAIVEPLKRRFGLPSVVAGTRDAPMLSGAVDLRGRTTLKQLVALIEKATLVIANDTGPMHIAAALGRPMIALFGPTNPLRTGPYRRLDTVLRVQMPCAPCYSRKCSHRSCLKWLTPDMVLRQVERLVSELPG